MKDRNLQQSEEKNVKYPGGLVFSDFKNLIEVGQEGWKNKMYVLFDANLIKDYQAISHEECKVFNQTLLKAQFCAARGEVGIKNFSGDSPICKVKINGKEYKQQITQELKIAKSPNRIAFYTLKPEAQQRGATILVACAYVPKGFHDKASLNKEYSTNDLALHLRKAAVVSSVGNNRHSLFAKENKNNFSKKAESNPQPVRTLGR